MDCRYRWAWFPVVVSGLVGLVSPAPLRADEDGTAFFESKIRPVLVAHCYECHSAKAAKVRGGLLLDTRDGLRNGGDTGPALIPGAPERSLLIKALRHDGLQMPPKKHLPDAVLADFSRWVRMGAPDPRTEAAAYHRMTAEEAKTFWSFRPVRGDDPPLRSGAPAEPIDRFILAGLEKKGLTAAVEAGRRTLIRRLSFDLVGLPPTPDEVEAFVGDRSENAVEKVVDRLLGSPRYGERWGRYWLDLARYAESNGNADNVPFPHAWHYRDYVIAAFNADKPYDRFITEQLAGDLLKADNARQKDELLIATGFLALTSKPRAQNNPDFHMDLIADQIDVTTRAILGLTVLCARCHDHKFDPISTKEYYGLAGIFDSTHLLAGGGVRGGGGKKVGGGVNGLHSLSDGGQAMGVREGRPTDCNVCLHGETQKKGDLVRRGFPAVGGPEKRPTIPSSVSGRLQLAEWLTARDNPLTARVAVNRIWQQLFGHGLVKSPDNFGSLGEKPSHPELLDWLAARFMEDGWSTKKLIRRIVLSRTYRMSSDHHAGNYKIDPDNIYLWRTNVRRIDAEEVRDAMLAVSGRLDLKPPTGSTTESAMNAKGKKATYEVHESAHRSVYLGVPRGATRPEVLALFDAANPNLVVAQREVTTVPAQALFLMNSPFVLEQARGLARRLTDASGLDTTGRIDLGYRLACGRPATEKECERVRRFLGDAPTPGRWVGFAQALLASAEFRYLD
jgi:hypothetical protein